MIWSKYNFVFKSPKYGWLLYNALSNSFVELPAELESTWQELKSGDEAKFEGLGLSLQLMAVKALVDKGEDDDLRDVMVMKRRLANSSEQIFLLTVAPTRRCNFACSYCFEHNRTGNNMSDEVASNLVEFAKRFAPAKHFGVTWFGGEPLLAFDRIESLTKEFLTLGFGRYQASIITNGYLLDEAKIAKLNELFIKDIQITIDGCKATHDSRRALLSGDGTFDKILSNIDLLCASDWSGTLLIRVNVDNSNKDEYHLIHDYLCERYQDRKIKMVIYPGIVHDIGEENPDTSCFFGVDDTADFRLEQFYKYGISDLTFYPGLKLFNCTATRRNGYVVGPDGELYKCWNDIGIKERVVGRIDSNQGWNNVLLAKWLESKNALNDQRCLDCKLMVICEGGCPAFRLEDKVNCTHYLNRLPELLEVHYELQHRKNNEE